MQTRYVFLARPTAPCPPLLPLVPCVFSSLFARLHCPAAPCITSKCVFLVAPLEQDVHLNGNQYAITTSDSMVAEARGLIANKTDGRIELGTFTFAQPEKTGAGEKLAGGHISASIKCPHVTNAGCTGASVAVVCPYLLLIIIKPYFFIFMLRGYSLHT